LEEREPSRGKRVFHLKRVTRWSERKRKERKKLKKDGAAFLVNRHLPRHIYEKEKEEKVLLGATTFTSSSSSSSLFPQK
jgi:hypothetical protein